MIGIAFPKTIIPKLGSPCGTITSNSITA
jgi:hypothetical protein